MDLRLDELESRQRPGYERRAGSGEGGQAELPYLARAQCRQRLRLRGQQHLAGVVAFAMQQEVGVKVEPALRDDVRFKRANGARGCVARIDGRSQPLRHALFVHLQECSLR